MTKKEHSEALTVTQRAELAALGALPDEEIDTHDISEMRDWSDAKRGLFYRPAKSRK